MTINYYRVSKNELIKINKSKRKSQKAMFMLVNDCAILSNFYNLNFKDDSQINLILLCKEFEDLQSVKCSKERFKNDY